MQVLVKLLDLIGSMVVLFKEKEYTLTDYESGILLPCLVEKCGHNQDRIRKTFKELLIGVCEIYNIRQASPMLLQGLSSKNHRTKLLCLDVFEALLGEQGYCV